MQKAPNYEEFRDTIWQMVIHAADGKWDTDDLKRYLREEEDLIAYEYKKAIKGYNSGATTYRQLTEGIPAGIAYNLQMSY